MSVNPTESVKGDESCYYDDPDFIKDVLKELKVDIEGKDAKELIEGIKKSGEAEKKDEKKQDKKMDEEEKK